jgi:fructokinase
VGAASASAASANPLLVIGEVLVDVVIDAGGTVTEHVGGSPANVAMGLSRLGHDATLCTCVGSDARGQLCRDHLEAQGVRVQVRATTEPTSVATATLDASGAAAYAFDLHWAPGPIDPGPFAHVHTGSIAATLAPGAADVSVALHAATPAATVSYDPNIRPSIMGDPQATRAQVESLIGVSDVVKASEDDVAYLYPGETIETVLARWLELGPALAVVTLGSQGVLYRCAADDEPANASAWASSVVDTVGAGDSFMAGLLSGLLDAGLLGGATACERLRAATGPLVAAAISRGLATSSLTVQRAGAYAPTRDETMTLISTRGRDHA